jgi:hypothetical protein
VLKLLGLPHNLPLVLKTIEEQYGIESNLTRSNKYKMVSSGISSKHRKSYLNLIKQVLPDDFEYSSELDNFVMRSHSVNSNAGIWLCSIGGYSYSDGPYQDLDQPVIDFIVDRALRDLEFLEKSKKRKISHEDVITQAEWLCDFINSNMLVSEETVGNYLNLVRKVDSSKDSTKIVIKDVHAILLFNISIEIDFYLSALVRYDTSIRRVFPKLNLEQTYQDILLKYVHVDEIRTVIESLLYSLKDCYEGELSWNDLADNINCSEPRNVLNKWRAGKETPSRQHIYTLIKNSSITSDEEKFVLDQYFKISILFDKLVKKWINMVNETSLKCDVDIDDHNRKHLINSVFFQVKHYYESHSLESH